MSKIYRHTEFFGSYLRLSVDSLTNLELLFS